MKRLIPVLMILCLLCGCGAPEEPSEPAVLTDTLPPAQTEQEEGLISVKPGEAPVLTEPDLPEETTTLGEEGVQYSVLERDDSIRNENGDVLVSICYQQIVLDKSRPEWENINALIENSYQAFREETAYLKETPPEEWEKMLGDMGAVYGNFMANISARVTHNADGILSIRMQRDWFMGGVFNSDPFALNFDLTTGEKLSLARLSDLPEQEFEAQLKTIVCDYLAPYREILFEDPAVTLESFALEDIPYCLEDGELVLLFSTYTFGPGTMGPTVIRTGFYPKL